jgi:uncharacterized UPF0160 family protein
VQAVPVSSDSFESRKALPEPWRGLRDDKLSEATGIPGCIFVHASGFIGGMCLEYLFADLHLANHRSSFLGTETKEGAIQLTKMALLS